MHAVRGYHVRSEEAYRIEIAHGGHPVLPQAVAHFGLGLGDMYMEPQTVPAGEVGGPAELLLPHRIHRMRGYHELDAPSRRIGEVLHEIHFLLLYGLGVVLHNRNAYGGAHTRLVDAVYRLLYVEVHVGKEGASGREHLSRRDIAPAPYVVGREPVLVRPDMVFEPLLEREVVGISAQQGHRSMRMGVEERGDYRKSRGVHHPVGTGVVRGVEIGEAPVGNQYVRTGSAVEHALQQDASSRHELAVHIRIGGKYGFRAREKAPSRRGKIHSGAVAQEQPRTRILLELAYMPAHGRLGYAELAGGRRKASQPRGGDEHLKPEILDNHILQCIPVKQTSPASLPPVAETEPKMPCPFDLRPGTTTRRER